MLDKYKNFKHSNLSSRLMAFLLSVCFVCNLCPIKFMDADALGNAYLFKIDISNASISDQQKWAAHEDVAGLVNTILTKYEEENSYSESNPLLIDSEEKLAAFAKIVNEEGKDFSGKYVMLVEDLDLDGKGITISGDEDGVFTINVSGTAQNAWTPIGSSTSSFKGTFNGGGHVIKNMLVYNEVYAGLFGVTNGAQIINLGIKDSNVIGYKYGKKGSHCAYTGGVVGYADNNDGNAQTYIRNCYNEGSKVYASATTSAYAGGIVGFYEGCESEFGDAITCCYNTGKVYAYAENNCSYSGGIIGVNTSYTSLSNCYNMGSVYASTKENMFGSSMIAYAGGIEGAGCNNTYIRACYNTGKVSAYGNNNAKYGGICNLDGSGVSAENVLNCYYLDDGDLYGMKIDGGVGEKSEYGVSMASEGDLKVAELAGFDNNKWCLSAGSYPELKFLKLMPSIDYEFNVGEKCITVTLDGIVENLDISWRMGNKSGSETTSDTTKEFTISNISGDIVGQDIVCTLSGDDYINDCILVATICAQDPDIDIVGVSNGDEYTCGEISWADITATQGATLQYKTSADEYADKPASGYIDEGSYTVKAILAASGMYNSAETEEIAFTVSYEEILGNPYTITDGYKANGGATIWTNNGMFKIKADSGYSISTSLNGTYYSNADQAIDCDGTSGSVVIYIKNSEGKIAKKTLTVITDTTSPTGEITIGENTWNTFLNKITFGLFFKETKQVTITATDAGGNASGISSIDYYVADHDIINNEGYSLTKESMEETLSTETFVATGTENGSTATFNLTPYGSYVIYAKITDNAGNVTFINSEGIIIYNDHVGCDTTSIDFIITSNTDQAISVTLNSNSIDKIYISDDNGENYSELANSNYLVATSGENDDIKIITFKASYLKTLDVANNYKIKITYNPQGFENAGDENRPTATVINLKINKANPEYAVPTNLTATYGDTLNDVTFAIVDNGVWSWQDALTTSVGQVGENTFKATFTPNDAASYNTVENIDVTIAVNKALANNVDTPIIDTIACNTKLSEITIGNGWSLVYDEDIALKAGEYTYTVYYDTDYDNYDWTNIAGYNEDTKRVERKVILKVDTNTSDWGTEVNYENGVLNYISDNGEISAEVASNGMIWLKEQSDGTGAWYAIDNTDEIFEIRSRFHVRWLNQEKDPDEFEALYNNFDEKYEGLIDSGKLWIFLTGVTAPGGTEYGQFDKDLTFYIEIGEDWNEDLIKAVFISDGEDEIVDVSFVDYVVSPEGGKTFAKLKLKHFSPYAVYEQLAAEQTAELDSNSSSSPSSSANSDSVKTGDMSIYILEVEFILLIASAAAVLAINKKLNKI